MTEPKDIRSPSDPWDPQMCLIGDSPEHLKAARIANYFIQKIVQSHKWRDLGRGWSE
jgi:hypothetical protein